MKKDRFCKICRATFKFTFLPLIVILIIILVISFPVYAATGCFLYSDSDSYCQEISSENAEIECSNYEDCIVEAHYLFGIACNTLEGCEKILCQSSCQEEYYGNCPYGAVSSNQQQEWCQPGCCRFEHAVGNYCEVLQNKWYCEIEASNKGVNEIHWSTTLNEEQCQQQCSATVSYQKFSLDKKDFSKEVPEQEQAETYTIPEVTTAELESEKTEEKLSVTASFLTPLIRAAFLGLLLGGLIIGTIIFFFRHWKEQRGERRKKKKKKEEFDYPLPKDEEKPVPKKRWWLFDPKEIARRLKLLKKKHNIKRKEHLLEESFGTFSKTKYQASHLDKLKHLVSARERKEKREKERKKRKEELRKKKSELHLQRVLAGEIKVKPKGGKNLTELERIEAVEELRAILRKKSGKK